MELVPDFQPSPEQWSDLLVCVGLMWKKVEAMSERLAELEAGLTPAAA